MPRVQRGRGAIFRFRGFFCLEDPRFANASKVRKVGRSRKGDSHRIRRGCEDKTFDELLPANEH